MKSSKKNKGKKKAKKNEKKTAFTNQGVCAFKKRGNRNHARGGSSASISRLNTGRKKVSKRPPSKTKMNGGTKRQEGGKKKNKKGP